MANAINTLHSIQLEQNRNEALKRAVIGVHRFNRTAKRFL